MSMTTPPDPGAPRRVTLLADDLLEMPPELLREAIHECFSPGTPGAVAMSKILAHIAVALMHGTTSPDGTTKMVAGFTRSQATRRAVELLEMAESLDGLDQIGRG